MTASYQEDPGFGINASSCLDLFNPNDEFGMPLWPPLPTSTQGASSFQLFGSDGDGSDSLANPHLTSANCPITMNGYMLASEATMNAASLLPDPSVGYSNNDLMMVWLMIRWAFGGENPSLQLFLPTTPSDASGPTDARNHHDKGNGLNGGD